MICCTFINRENLFWGLAAYSCAIHHPISLNVPLGSDHSATGRKLQVKKCRLLRIDDIFHDHQGWAIPFAATVAAAPTGICDLPEKRIWPAFNQYWVGAIKEKIKYTGHLASWHRHIVVYLPLMGDWEVVCNSSFHRHVQFDWAAGD